MMRVLPFFRQAADHGLVDAPDRSFFTYSEYIEILLIKALIRSSVPYEKTQLYSECFSWLGMLLISNIA